MALGPDVGGPSGVRTLAGTPEEVRAGLRGSHADKVVALALEHVDPAMVQALVTMLGALTPLVESVVQSRQKETLRRVVEALVPNVPPPRHKLIEARMTAEARKAVLEGGDWLTAAQVAAMAGLSPSNPSAQPNKWKRAGQIFALRHNGVDYFPGYALDSSNGFRPAKGLTKVLEVLRGHKDDWGLAYWFASVNSALGGQRPQDLLIAQPARVLTAAEDEVAGTLHG